MRRILKVLFFIITLLFCYAVYIENDLLRTISKPLPLIILLILIKPNSKYKTLIFVGFIFSLVGDVFLLKVIDQFIFGLASFFIAHFFYIIAFRIRGKEFKLIGLTIFYFIATVLVFVFYPHITKDLILPVIFYIYIIMTMVWGAWNQRKYNQFSKFAFIGAVLFAISDFNIALTKFIYDYDFSKIVTIILYWSAQYLIYKSTTKA